MVLADDLVGRIACFRGLKASESRLGSGSKPMVDRNSGVKSRVAIAILLSKQQPRIIMNGAPKRAARLMIYKEASFDFKSARKNF